MQIMSPELRFLPFMESTHISLLPEGSEWSYEIKFDGYRCQAIKQRGEVRLFSRNGKDYTDRYPGVVADLLSLRAKEFVQDGEVVAVDGTGKHDFHLLQRAGTNKAPVHFYAFDVLWLEGQDTTKLPLRKRRTLLEANFTQKKYFFHLSPTLEADPAALLAAVEAQGFEGLMAKRLTSK